MTLLAVRSAQGLLSPGGHGSRPSPHQCHHWRKKPGSWERRTGWYPWDTAASLEDVNAAPWCNTILQRWKGLLLLQSHKAKNKHVSGVSPNTSRESLLHCLTPAYIELYSKFLLPRKTLIILTFPSLGSTIPHACSTTICQEVSTGLAARLGCRLRCACISHTVHIPVPTTLASALSFR